MLCDICKEKKAIIHFTQIINGEMKNMHLCLDCAKKLGIDAANIEKQVFGETFFPLADFLSKWAEFYLPEVETKKCPGCGITYADFKEQGLLGCSRCYDAFNQELDYLLKKLQGNSYHSGKNPHFAKKSAEPQVQIEELEKKLKEAIEKEEYEQAAIIRDKIKEIKNKMEKK